MPVLSSSRSDIHREPRDALEPVPRSGASVVGGAAGDEHDAVDAREVGQGVGKRDGAAVGDVMRDGLGQDGEGIRARRGGRLQTTQVRIEPHEVVAEAIVAAEVSTWSGEAVTKPWPTLVM